MTKDEFMKKLADELDKYQIKDKEQIIQQYENYFLLGHQAKMSDEEIISRYPSIDEIVKSYVQEVSVVKEYEYSRNDTKFAKGNFKKIIVSLISDDIEFIYDNEIDGIKVTFSNVNANRYKVDTSLDTFKLTYDAENLIKKTSIFDLGKKAKVKIFLPVNTQYELIFIKSVSASINLNYIQAEEIKVETVSGNIKANRLQVQNINISSVSGCLNATYVESNNVKLRFVSGKCIIDQADINNFSISGVSTYCEIKSGNIVNTSTSCLSGKVVVLGKKVN